MCGGARGRFFVLPLVLFLFIYYATKHLLLVYYSVQTIYVYITLIALEVMNIS